jgi:hypothetical protein
VKTKSKKLSRLTKALLETADDLHMSGLMNDADYNTITLRHLGKEKISTAEQGELTEIQP